MSDSAWTIDVGDADFETEVLKRSEVTPVVVDFWAPWCGPCRALGPLLERLADEHQGAFVLAKVNVDEAPAVAQAFGIQSIPAVKGFRDGMLVAEFVGAQPEPAVRKLLETVLPSTTDRLVAEAAALAPDAAEAALREALETEPRHARALLALARIARGARRHGRGAPAPRARFPAVAAGRRGGAARGRAAHAGRRRRRPGSAARADRRRSRRPRGAPRPRPDARRARPARGRAGGAARRRAARSPLRRRRRPQGDGRSVRGARPGQSVDRPLPR